MWNKIYSEFKTKCKLYSQEHPNETIENVENIVLKEFSSLLGRRIKRIVTGGAPTSPTVKEFVKKCFQCDVIDSYGITEVGGVFFEGKVLSQVQVKLQSIPEMGYFITDHPPRGEILVKSPFMASGYFGDPKLTEESFVEGYFKTGDIGTIDENGNLIVIDRKKNIFKLSQGEFVAIEKLETIFSESTLVNQIFIVGKPTASYLVAVIVPNVPENFLKFSYENERTQVHSEELKQQLLKDFHTLAKEYFLQPFEIPRTIHFEFEPWTLENGLLTGKGK